jgi:hypothetical protein
MTFGRNHLLPLFAILATAIVVPPTRAQFTGAGGVIGPAGLPGARLNYGGRGYGYRGYGYGGYGTNWMQNPYGGYLNGVANVTTANAQYQLTIQQASQAREEARRSSLKTRRATIEERQYELSLMPDPEQIRQDQMRRSLQRSRNNPPPTDIWSGKALNDLLRSIQNAQTRGVTGPTVPLSPDVLKHVNVNTGTTYGGTGLLKDGGKLTWPFPLRQPAFDAQRKTLDQQMVDAVKQAPSGNISVELLNDIGASLKQMEQTIDARVDEVTPSQLIESMRYLRELKESYKVLQQGDVAKFFGSNRTPQGKTVADLVQQMTKEGLRFGPAVSGEESYYTSLHQSLVDYDIGNTQLTTTSPLR